MGNLDTASNFCSESITTSCVVCIDFYTKTLSIALCLHGVFADPSQKVHHRERVMFEDPKSIESRWQSNGFAEGGVPNFDANRNSFASEVPPNLSKVKIFNNAQVLQKLKAFLPRKQFLPKNTSTNSWPADVENSAFVRRWALVCRCGSFPKRNPFLAPFSAAYRLAKILIDY